MAAGNSARRWCPSLAPKEPFVGTEESHRIETQADEALHSR
jgi:hypothetical protein